MVLHSLEIRSYYILVSGLKETFLVLLGSVFFISLEGDLLDFLEEALRLSLI
jgi:hypothetical protein